MEAHPDFVFGDGDVGRHVDEVAEDLARLGVSVSAHAACHGAPSAGTRLTSVAPNAATNTHNRASVG